MLIEIPYETKKIRISSRYDHFSSKKIRVFGGKNVQKNLKRVYFELSTEIFRAGVGLSDMRSYCNISTNEHKYIVRIICTIVSLPSRIHHLPNSRRSHIHDFM